ncbi:voltage-gated potassium channel [Ekhidna lutea]|uniref:Voltage-gated potassium channel n=1 Tax=Ekhidna lutea TaxID=447679 RepID=A0A239LAE7_EKHLU|nr:ion transporter [Ekhidna lutea]SNT26629.1 voltage-gated potassium channel [Ekhidna lutea]
MSEPDFKYFPRLRNQLFHIVFGTDTRAGKLFDIILLWAIVLSVLSVMLESVKEISETYDTVFFISEWFFTILFTVEYILRLSITAKPKKYAFSFFGIIDLLATLPTYITLFVAGGSYLIVIRSIRLLRIFRILKLGRYLREASVLSNALAASRYKIFIFLGAVFTLAMIMGTLMYMIEGGESGFTSIPRSIYWAIVTITTVGYGDIAPQTVLGQSFASMLMLMGYAIIAVPTGIVTSEIAQAEKDKKKEESSGRGVCVACGKKGHDDDAIFCKNCSAKL